MVIGELFSTCFLSNSVCDVRLKQFTCLLLYETSGHQPTQCLYTFGFKIKMVLLTLQFTPIPSEGNFGKRLSFSQPSDSDVHVCVKQTKRDKYSNRSEKKTD